MPLSRSVGDLFSFKITTVRSALQIHPHFDFNSLKMLCYKGQYNIYNTVEKQD